MNSNAITQSTYSVPRSPNVVGSVVEIEVTNSESRPNSPKKKYVKHRSRVWEDFIKSEKEGKEIATCKHCKKFFDGCSKNGTSHLKNHYERCLRRTIVRNLIEDVGQKLLSITKNANERTSRVMSFKVRSYLYELYSEYAANSGVYHVSDKNGSTHGDDMFESNEAKKLKGGFKKFMSERTTLSSHVLSKVDEDHVTKASMVGSTALIKLVAQSPYGFTRGRCPETQTAPLGSVAQMPDSTSYDFYVGGRDGWVQNPSENYNNWSSRNRFQIKDNLVFKYKNGEDSVLVVKKEDYESCNTNNPIKKLEV
ncbi:hypothetical protein QJS10_CPA03g00805 [Acorus calamus]|uniref:BED-type domain-containing protein n=1 Tax=Acorus calamus TaxID=4465 RepID=A0AAV9F7I7_ACOCL|nr:hypothetical protein QJS10_CPA03g00805 [Acorus calamus]